MNPHDPIDQARALTAGDRAPRAAITRLQQHRLAALLDHARTHSPYYRKRLPATRGPLELASLPTLDKATVVDCFDDIVTDPALRGGPLAAQNAHRTLRTSGSSGRPGLFVYDAQGWASYVAQFLRVTAFAGHPMWEHRGLRVGVVAATEPVHASAQVARSCIELGLIHIQPLPVTLPLEHIVAGLNAYQPDVLHAYASYAALLADEQRAGRLRINPRLVTSSSELLTAPMATRVQEAFAIAPFDFYATTEGLWASQCREHAGFHIFDELCLVENVDADDRPVPPGVPGARVLVTNLFNRIQPLIRYEIPDILTIDPQPCPCGRTLPRIRSIHGRSADLLTVDGVTIHPLHFAALTADPAIREFQIVQHADRLTLRLVPNRGPAGGDLRTRIPRQLTAALRDIGIRRPNVDVELCETIKRPASGKLQLVLAHPQPDGGTAGRP